MRKAVDESAAAALVAAEHAVRRVLRRLVDGDSVDDLTQDTLERVVHNVDRLEPGLVVPYAVVTARNLAASRARRLDRWRRLSPHRLGQGYEPDPYEPLAASEIAAAVSAALDMLEPHERQLLVDAAGRRDGPAATGGADGPAARARLRRVRAKARLEYLLAYRRIELPTARCRPVLLSLSLGDVRAQGRCRAAEHLVRCEVCRDLAGPLVRRRSDLALWAFPVVAARWLWTKVSAHGVLSATVAAAGAAAIVAVVALVPSAQGRVGAKPQSTTTRPAPVPARPAVKLCPAGGPRPQPIGQSVAEEAVVAEPVTRNGFWATGAGTPQADWFWVQLVGPLRDIELTRGSHIRLQGRILANSSNFVAEAGVPDLIDARRLAALGCHVEVDTGSVTLLPT